MAKKINKINFIKTSGLLSLKYAIKVFKINCLYVVSTLIWSSNVKLLQYKMYLKTLLLCVINELQKNVINKYFFLTD